MKEMIYSEERRAEILHEGEYKGYHFVIVSYGIHPCAYVEIPSSHRWFGVNYDDIDISCHYGLTYSDNLDHVIGASNKWFIGWDYAHSGDYEGYNPKVGFGLDDKKWTTKEIYEEVKDVIEQIIEMDKTITKYQVGEIVLYQNGDRFEIGIVKSVCDGDDYFVNYHTGDTAARTNARNLHKLENSYAFHVIRLDPDGNERR